MFRILFGVFLFGLVLFAIVLAQGVGETFGNGLQEYLVR